MFACSVTQIFSKVECWSFLVGCDYLRSPNSFEVLAMTHYYILCSKWHTERQSRVSAYTSHEEDKLPTYQEFIESENNTPRSSVDNLYIMRNPSGIAKPPNDPVRFQGSRSQQYVASRSRPKETDI